MQPRTWSERLTIGHAVLDAEHQQLLACVEQLGQASGFGTDPAVIGHALDLFRDHVTAHFRGEEAEMARTGFPGLEEHRVQHQGLASIVLGLVATLDRGETVVHPQVMAAAEKLVEHVERDDIAYATFLRRSAGRLQAKAKPKPQPKPAARRKPMAGKAKRPR